MIYIFETELPLNKSIFISLVYIYGIGKFNASLLCKQLGFSKNLETKNLYREQVAKITKLLEFYNFKLAEDLKKIESLNFKKIVLIKCYIGLRKIKGLPVRGQRTHTNSKTAKKSL